jgi:hypothetical protein
MLAGGLTKGGSSDFQCNLLLSTEERATKAMISYAISTIIIKGPKTFGSLLSAHLQTCLP